MDRPQRFANGFPRSGFSRLAPLGVRDSDALPLLVSVVVRSYNRLTACTELIERTLAQDYAPFEVIVIEQSTEATAAQRARLAQLSAEHDNLQIVTTPPLGPAGARNLGWRRARGEIVVFMDDDDLPLGRDWIAKHVGNYADPDIIGVSGREVLDEGERCPERYRTRARRRCLSYSFLGYPYVYCRSDERVEPVAWLHGGNSSIRRSYLDKLGGWQEGLDDHEEHSLAFKLARVLEGKQRLVFDPDPTMLRRKNVGGGLERRVRPIREVFLGEFDYYHRVIGRYRTGRLVLLYPVYLVLMLTLALRWIRKDSQLHPARGGKLRASVVAILAFPRWWLLGWYSLLGGRRRAHRHDLA